jgi:hypothetical protein
MIEIESGCVGNPNLFQWSDTQIMHHRPSRDT